MTRSSVWDSSEIIFTRPTSESEHSAESNEHNLLGMFDGYSGGFLALLDAAFVLGTRNPFAEGLFAENGEDFFEIDKSLRDSEMFVGPFTVLYDDSELIRKVLEDIGVELDTHRADAEVRATEQPMESVSQILALEHSLEIEKTWSEAKEEENEMLKTQLRRLNRKIVLLESKLRKNPKLSSIPANPLSKSIGAVLRPKPPSGS